MISIPDLAEYDVSPTNGFLPTLPPLQSLPDPYYEPWEHIMKNLQGLILSKRLRETVEALPVLSTEKLISEPEWRRAYSVLAILTHSYVWGHKRPRERIPQPISIPFLAICKHLELPLVATYAGVCLWNWKPIFDNESFDTLANLDVIDTFTGSLDEKWFYLISIAIEAKGGPLIPLMLDAIAAADENDRETVTHCLQLFAERLDDIVATLSRMYDQCDPHVFYHRIRPFLAGSKNMADAGLPNGVVFDNGGPINKQRYVQFSGGSNAQSSLIQFFDLVLSIQHLPTKPRTNSASEDTIKNGEKPKPSGPNFIHEMRQYMPGKHARFLSRVAEIANLRDFVKARQDDRQLCVAFDACVAMLTALRDKHIQIVSRYVVIKSREAAADMARKRPTSSLPRSNSEVDLATRPKPGIATRELAASTKVSLKGTGGSSLIPFLRQARNETGEPAIGAWARRVLAQRSGVNKAANFEPDELSKLEADVEATWIAGGSIGGLCNW